LQGWQKTRGNHVTPLFMIVDCTAMTAAIHFFYAIEKNMDARKVKTSRCRRYEFYRYGIFSYHERSIYFHGLGLLL